MPSITINVSSEIAEELMEAINSITPKPEGVTDLEWARQFVVEYLRKTVKRKRSLDAMRIANETVEEEIGNVDGEFT